MTAIPEDIMQEHLGFLDRKHSSTDREIEMSDALRRGNPSAEMWRLIWERAKAMRAVDDAIERGNQ